MFYSLLLCIYSPPFSPFPDARAQICRLYPRDAEADPGADAGRSLAGLYVVHTHLSEQLYPPALHFRWVHSCIKSVCGWKRLQYMQVTITGLTGCISATYSSKQFIHWYQCLGCLFQSQIKRQSSMSPEATNFTHHHPSSFSKPWNCHLAQTLAVCSCQAPSTWHLIEEGGMTLQQNPPKPVIILVWDGH